MAGGVWEWTGDWYDAEGYRKGVDRDPRGPETGEQKVLRGGSWADCAECVTVSFRMAWQSQSWRNAEGFGCPNPTIGFRLCRETQ